MDNDNALGSDSASVGVLAEVHESARWHCKTVLRKFNGDSTAPEDMYEELEIDGNILVTGGVSALWEYAMGRTTVGYLNNASAAIGVGTNNASTTANETTGDTGLAATNASDRLRKGMDATYPQHSDGTSGTAPKTITLRSTFATTEANFVWNEWGVFNSVAETGTGLNRMINRKVQALGTKAAGTTWQLTVTITIN